MSWYLQTDHSSPVCKVNFSDIPALFVSEQLPRGHHTDKPLTPRGRITNSIQLTGKRRVKQLDIGEYEDTFNQTKYDIKYIETEKNF